MAILAEILYIRYWGFPEDDKVLSKTQEYTAYILYTFTTAVTDMHLVLRLGEMTA